MIVTQNVRDFPPSATPSYDITVSDQDGFLLDQWDLDPSAVRRALPGRSPDTAENPAPSTTCSSPWVGRGAAARTSRERVTSTAPRGPSDDRAQGDRVRGRDRAGDARLPGGARGSRRTTAASSGSTPPSSWRSSAPPRRTQWDKLVAYSAVTPTPRSAAFAERLAKEIDERGAVDVLRHGVEDHGRHDPARVLQARRTASTPSCSTQYEANRLTVTRQLPYDDQDRTTTLDLCLFVNGIPVATAELKNPLTGQAVEHAKTQYRTDRDPTNADSSRGGRWCTSRSTRTWSSMTTRLAGQDDPVPAVQPWADDRRRGQPARTRTATGPRYLWERGLAARRLARPARPLRPRRAGRGTARRQAEAERDDLPALPPVGRGARSSRPTPRDARVRARTTWSSTRPARASRNTIAWLAHRLVRRCTTPTTRTVFDKVVVITDRVVLDRQLQDTIYQFEHAHGVVEKIDEDSAQLADGARRRAGADHHHDAAEVPVRPRQGRRRCRQRRYAVIVDEAHSSQTGEAAKDAEGGARRDAPRRARRGRGRGRRTSRRPAGRAGRGVAARGRQPNLSFFAFTATPKAQDAGAVRHATTRRRQATRRSTSTRCARRSRRASSSTCSPTTRPTRRTGSIEQGRSPTTPSTTQRKADAAIARFVDAAPAQPRPEGRGHRRALPRPHRHKIGGQAKAMVVTRSAAARRALQAGASTATSTTRATPTSARWSRSPGTVDDSTAIDVHRGRR